jgi:hypothetical protein
MTPETVIATHAVTKRDDDMLAVDGLSHDVRRDEIRSSPRTRSGPRPKRHGPLDRGSLRAFCPPMLRGHRPVRIDEPIAVVRVPP